MAAPTLATSTNIDVAEIVQGYDLETLREKALARQKKFEQVGELAITEGATPEGKAYLENLHKDPTKRVFDFKTLLDRAEHFLAKVETVETKALSISYEDAKQLFWAIYKTLLMKYKNEIIMTDSLKDLLPDLIKYFIGHEQTRFDTRKGLWVCGGIGTGKTTLLEAFSIFTKTLDYNRFEVVNCKSIVLHVRQKKDFSILSDYIKKSLCYDDIAAEEKAAIYGNQDEIIQSLLEDFYHTRFKKGHLLHATSNIHLAEIGERYTDNRLVSRINEMFNPVVLKGDDFRKQ